MVFDSICDSTKSAIDIGCGNGLFTKKITDKFKTIVAIDINPVRVKNLKDYFENEKIQNVIVLEMSAYTIDKKDNSFDRAIFYRSVDHIYDYYLALKESYRILKIKGVIYINILDTRYSTIKTRNLDNFRYFADELYDALEIGEGVCEIRMVDIEKLFTQLTEIGFSRIRIETTETGSTDQYFERINKDIHDLLEKIKNAFPNEHLKYYSRYKELLQKIVNEGIEFRPTLEIVGVK